MVPQIAKPVRLLAWPSAAPCSIASKAAPGGDENPWGPHQIKNPKASPKRLKGPKSSPLKNLAEEKPEEVSPTLKNYVEKMQDI
ncbi:hypothetical protein [Salinibacter ruber]|uniref:hypothetical protein n=1 Tax=Salinibacter ruber TaxID=146919 RepID=UPI00130E69B8|nr:hypothetical protein [Salinibacter ruber]